MRHRPFLIKAVLFDFDGTLTKPESLDLSIIKKKIGCPVDSLILEFIENLPAADQRRKARQTLDQFELAAAADAEPNPGAEDLILFLRSMGMRLGIISRNSRESIERSLQNFASVSASDFDVIISRDEPVKPKPSGDGIVWAARKLRVDVDQILIVGDYVWDILAGNRAGAMTAFLNNNTVTESSQIKSDFTITRLDELKEIIRLGKPLPAGKLPNRLLQEFLKQFGFEDPSVIINPGVGEDTAAVNVEKEEVLILKADPVTFATDSIGHYAILINANDIATSGAVPRWFLTTLLFPTGTTASAIKSVMHELHGMCRQYGITLCGGHTEITDSVTRAVITGMMAGTVAKSNLIDKSNIAAGDKVLFTKAVAVEGTAIIAREFASQLNKLGMSEREIENCRQFLLNISILEEAEVARRTKGVSAMHDVTEGGLATALEELSVVAGHKIKVDMDQIPIFPQTQKICGLLGIHPLGLIGSGSLLICCNQKYSQELINKIRRSGIDVSCIGEITGAGVGIVAVSKRKEVEWPSFAADELTRLY
ncbi:MAG: HAD-IA family hydrolase [Deltaproteobacteria bacterium]|nr:MAG: HAD-IA family hydrolase [Deltaproteobacteria bacterium]